MTQNNPYARGPGALPIFVRLVTGSIQHYQTFNAEKIVKILEEIQHFFDCKTVSMFRYGMDEAGSACFDLLCQTGMTPAQKKSAGSVPAGFMLNQGANTLTPEQGETKIPLYAAGGDETVLVGLLYLSSKSDGTPWTKEEAEALHDIAQALATCLSRLVHDSRS